MAFPLLDTSVFPTYKKQIEKRFEFIYFSTIVLYELTASTIDQSTLQKYERWKIALNKADRLLTPSMNDYWVAANAVRRLRLLKLINKNLAATVLQNAALIARSAYTRDYFVVTENIKDFSLLQKMMPKLEVIPAAEFFN